MRDALVPQEREQFARTRQRPALGHQLAEQRAVTPLDGFCFGVGKSPTPLAGDGAGEQAAAHPDAPVDAPAIDRQPGLGQRALSGEYMGIDGVDKRPVEVEDQRLHAPSPTSTRGTSTECSDTSAASSLHPASMIDIARPTPFTCTASSRVVRGAAE